MAAPTTEKKPYEMVAHGDKRIDNYYWMNDFFKKCPDSTKVVDYLKAENAYLDTMTHSSAKLRAKLYEEMKSRIMETDVSVPYLKEGYYYYSRYEQGKEYPIYCRKKGRTEAAEEIMLMQTRLAKETLLQCCGS